jgi:hypothetical protein
MRQRTLTRLAISGFCFVYAGLMGGLLVAGMPLAEGHLWDVVLYLMLPLTAIGIAIIVFEKRQRMDAE